MRHWYNATIGTAPQGSAQESICGARNCDGAIYEDHPVVTPSSRRIEIAVAEESSV